MDTERRNVTPRNVGAATGRSADAAFQWPPPDEGSEPLQADATVAAEPGQRVATQPVPGITPRVPDPADAPYLELQEALRKRQTAAENTAQTNHAAETGPVRPEVTHRPSAGLQSHKYDAARAPRASVAHPLRQPSTAGERTGRNHPVRRQQAWPRSQVSWLRSRMEDVAFAVRNLVAKPLRQRRSVAERTAHINHPPRKASEHSVPSPPPTGWLDSYMFWVAFALVTLVATAEGIYILRPGWFPTTPPATVVAEAPLVAPPNLAVVPNPEVEPKADRGRERLKEDAVATTGAGRGRLRIDSEPSGAEVSIDGRVYGTTPLALADVTPGQRRIVLKLAGREVRQTIRVEPGGMASVIAPMSNLTTSPSGNSGWIAIVSKAELDIFEKGVLVGSTRSPQVMVPAGVHTLRLVNEMLGYEGTQTISVEPGKVARVNLTLPESTINVNALPWAEVWIDGKSIGETPIGNLPLGIGTHEIVFRHPDLGEKTVSTVVKANAPTRVTVDLRK